MRAVRHQYRHLGTTDGTFYRAISYDHFRITGPKNPCVRLAGAAALYRWLSRLLVYTT